MNRKLFVMGLITACGMFLSGCHSTFGLNGLPNEQYRVGGGFNIEYDAPTDGTFYLVDQSSGKFIVTENVSEGDGFEFSIDPGMLEEAEACGVDIKKSKLVLYFVPKPQEQ